MNRKQAQLWAQYKELYITTISRVKGSTKAELGWAIMTAKKPSSKYIIHQGVPDVLRENLRIVEASDMSVGIYDEIVEELYKHVNNLEEI